MIKTRSERKIILLEIIKDLFDKDIETSLESENLLGRKVGLDAVDLVYLYNAIVKRFDIEIPESYIIGGKFSTINDILDIFDDLKSMSIS